MKSTDAELGLIARLVVVLSALTGQLRAAVNEINDANVGAIVSVRHICRLIGYVSDAIAAAKAGNDTPSERSRVVGGLLGRLKQLEADEQLRLNTRSAASAQTELAITSAAIAQVLAVTAEEAA
ncbi:hypothetical protein BAAM0483_02365 [Bifidobacterium animalis subsp. animalis MCC 0483]|uniref:Uncharacterized protein n=1 Tax=Bifidobacterium animalis subsp. animalis MCC 0483 TaxID=1365955 RepID=A0AB34TAJ7_9BIFI|nr:hypothetical protein [Bifidobacterium animalis]KOA51096.1 hypothetical protein BAAM0483_02365 [Bifidobacterium animalis subsp. animalis MCC 0483]